MKTSIKLFTTEKPTKKGFPIYVKIEDAGFRKKKCIGYSFAEDWDFKSKEPFRHHPNYYDLLPVVMEYKSKIKKINFGSYSFKDARNLLFEEKPVNDLRFYDACLKFCDKTTNGKLYRTVINSFNMVFPSVQISQITREMARTYMLVISGKQKPNGVHVYLRTLNALYNKISVGDNPFKGIRPKKARTPNKSLTDNDLVKLFTTRSIKNRFDNANTNETINHYRYYWMLMFYLGGIDCIDLANLRYDKHVVGNRVQFTRHKGGTNVFINNLIVPQARTLLKKFDCWPYLVPIYTYKNHNDFVSNMNERFCDRVEDLQLTKKPLTKSARYTFITRAQQLLVDERITVEIVGHQQQRTHSIYTDEFPLKVRDAAHLKIVDIAAFNLN